jgi:endonuclease YncB( thermonuclease family)
MEGVYDGDTLRARALGAPPAATDEHVRLAWVDAPERRQAYGPEARSALVALVQEFGLKVPLSDGDYMLWLAPRGAGGWNRVVGGLFAWDGGRPPADLRFEASLNRRLVVAGAAWEYSHPAWWAGRGQLDGLTARERAASRAGRGLWALGPPPVMPRWWRRGEKAGAGWLRHLPKG